MRLIGLEHLRTFHVKLSINYIWHRVKFVIAPSEFDELQYYIGNKRTVPNTMTNPSTSSYVEITMGLSPKTIGHLLYYCPIITDSTSKTNKGKRLNGKRFERHCICFVLQSRFRGLWADSAVIVMVEAVVVEGCDRGYCFTDEDIS